MSVCISIPSDSLSVFDYCKCIPLNFCQASHSPFFAQNTHIWQIVQMDPGMTIQCPSTITTNNYQQLPTTTNNYQQLPSTTTNMAKIFRIPFVHFESIDQFRLIHSRFVSHFVAENGNQKKVRVHARRGAR